MKKIFPYLLAIILMVIIFSGCKPLFPSEYDQFDFGDTVSIAISETIYETEDLWVRLDSITEDSRCPEGIDCIWAGRVVLWITVADGWGDGISISFASDTCMEARLCFNDLWLVSSVTGRRSGGRRTSALYPRLDRGVISRQCPGRRGPAALPADFPEYAVALAPALKRNHKSGDRKKERRPGWLTMSWTF